AIEKRYKISLLELFRTDSYYDIKREISLIIAQVLASLSRIFDPGLIILGGGMMESYNQLRPLIEEGVATYLSPTIREGLRIEVGRLGDRSGVIGAANLLSEH